MENKKPKIVLVVDQPNWAFAISAKDMVKFMPQYDFSIVNWYQNPKDVGHYIGADLVYLFGHYMHSWMPDDFDFSKSCTGVRALFGYVDDRNAKDHKQDPRTADGAQHILKFPIIHTVSKESYNLFKDFHPNVSYVCHGVDTGFYTQKRSYEKRNPFVLGWAGNRGNLVKGIALVESVLKDRKDIILKTAEFGDKQLNAQQLKEFYQSLDAFILPSISEGCSAALLEAMSCGLPIIATDTGSWIELKNCGGGITIERNEKSINDALNQIINMSNDELKNMGNNSRNEMVKHWDWSIKAKDFDAFFKKALSLPAESKKTIKMFDEKWKHMPKGYGSADQKQVEFFANWATKKYGLNNVEELNKFYANKHNILEVGFGSAFNMDYISRLTSGSMTGVDSSPTACKLAEEKFKDNKNISILNVSIMDLGGILKDNSYDLIVADGVLHHLKDTKKAIDLLYKKLASGGHMYVYLYKKMGRVREFTNDLLRFNFKDMKPEECIKACENLTKLGQALSSIKTKVKIDAVPVLGLEAGEYTPQEIMYYGVIKCFWNDSFTFEVNNMNNYDWFAPEYAWRFDSKEITKMLEGKNYKLNNANPNGWSILIQK